MSGTRGTGGPELSLVPLGRVDSHYQVKEPPEYANIAAGAGHSCLVTSTGRVQCWGDNQFGQLGGGEGQFFPLEYAPQMDGDARAGWSKTYVRGLTARVTAISAGYYHTCVLTEVGAVQCWGRNDRGQLGGGSNLDSSRPVTVRGVEGDVISLASGAEHTCVLLDGGTAYCWGENGNGQLGDSTNRNSSSPVMVQSLPEKIVQITGGTGFTCALAHSGRVYCWGNGENGRFGDGLQGNHLLPVELDGLREPVARLVAGDFHLCAQLDTGKVICWGALSSEREYNQRTPMLVGGLPGGGVQLVAGGGHTCILTTSDGVKCLGDNYFGQLGDGNDYGSWEPVDAIGLTTGVMRIASGSGHVCALLSSGGVQCWGDCSNGQCGDGSLTWNWSSYTSHKYRFLLDYPSGWNVLELPNQDYPTADDQVWFASADFPPTYTGARPEVTLIITQEDPSLGWDLQYFDDYRVEEIYLGNVEAIKFNGINKESRYYESAIIIQTGDYFILAIPNESPDAQSYFDQILDTLTITWELVSPVHNKPPFDNPTPAVRPVPWIEITDSNGLLGNIELTRVPAYRDPSGFMYHDHPEHIRVDFPHSYTERWPFVSLAWVPPWLGHQPEAQEKLVPQIFIFQVDSFARLSLLAGQRIESLKGLLETESLPLDEELPLLPLFNSTQDIRARAEPMAFQNGDGIRFIARYSQETAVVVNPTVFYTFQGLTSDGQFYIAVFFPVYTRLIPDQVSSITWDSYGQPYQEYLVVIRERLENLRPEDFTPNLDQLDQLIQAIEVNPVD